MKIIITERQYIGLISEQTAPFYYQPTDSTGKKNLNSDYVFDQGGPMTKPKGAIDAKLLFPDGKFPKTITAKQANEFMSKQFSLPKLNPSVFQYKDAFSEMVAILFYARDISWAEGIKKDLFNNKSDIELFAASILEWVSKHKGYNPKILNAAISVVFRESKASSASFLNPKEIVGKFQNWIGMPDVYVFGTNIGGDDHSQGYAQIKPSTAKRYNIDMDSLNSFYGSLDAVYKMLTTNYEKAKNFYNGDTVTISENGQLKQVKALGDDAALQMAVAAHNAGEGLINQWCETNIKGIANICSINQRKPYKDQNTIAVTNKSKQIPNYFPNIGGVHKYMPQFRKSYNALAKLPEIIPTATPPSKTTNKKK